MSVQLPPAIAAYFAAHNAHDAEAAASCFEPDALVEDEKLEHRGREAIRAWKEESVRRYRPTAEPLSAESGGWRSVVRAKVSGDFPGSPVELVFDFTLGGDKIRRLRITVA